MKKDNTKKRYVWVVLERWNLDIMEADVTVWQTQELARGYAEEQAHIMQKTIDYSVINYDREGCDMCVEKEDGHDDEWWEARIVEREVNGEEKKANEVDEAWLSLDDCIDTIAKNEKGEIDGN